MTVAILLFGLPLGSVALAQGTTMDAIAVATQSRLAPSGDPAPVLPAAALLLGTDMLTYAILKRRV